MKPYLKTTLSIALIAVISGCSGKSFTMQDYADEWFNNTPKEEVTNTKDKTTKEAPAESTTETVVQKSTEPKQKSSSSISDEETNKAIKSGPGADIAWSSTYKQDEKMKGQGAMQKGLDTWTKEEWVPATEGDANQTQKDKEANEHFTIQHYVDKYEKYRDKDKQKWQDSGKKRPEANYEKINRLPVIGK